MRRFVWAAIAVLLAVVIISAYWFLIASPLTVTVISAVSVSPGEATTILNASGYLVAQRRAAVASKGTGRLVELRVKEGDRVKKGEIIARLESADVEAALAGAKASLNEARALKDQAETELNEAALNHGRKKGLFESGLLSKAEFETARARYLRARASTASFRAGIKAAEATVRAAEVDIENTIILAPFDGTILTKNAEVGEVVAPFGSSSLARVAVVTMADMASIQVEADVSESNIEKIYPGQICRIVLDAYPGLKYEGIVQTIVPTVDRAKATIMTKIRLLKQDDRVLPEMSARVTFMSQTSGKGDEKPRVAVHPGAVILRGDKKVAFLVDRDRVREISVEVGNPL
ncbi:MAG TPA: efflux RND transporter periplasmic adaptor subunit, partial [Nitrospiria bacterium]|nr:efflux RND transporter periplasmic adaptor subunit [Nitrospiria bacterium]